MKLIPVTYSGAIKDKVDTYNALPSKDKLGTYWENTNDGSLTDVKEHIKKHYIDIQDYTCPYCRQKIIVDHKMVWDAEHIIDKDSKPGFLFEPENLCVSCKDCNGLKKRRNVLGNPSRVTFPNKSEDYIFSHPHFDDYDENVKVIHNPLFFIPRTKKGIATIEICGLLRFLYLLSEYKNVPAEIGEQIGLAQKELMDAKTASEQIVILSFIKERCDQGIKLALHERFAHLLASSEAVHEI